jgi:hypothetical protein
MHRILSWRLVRVENFFLRRIQIFIYYRGVQFVEIPTEFPFLIKFLLHVDHGDEAMVARGVKIYQGLRELRHHHRGTPLHLNLSIDTATLAAYHVLILVLVAKRWLICAENRIIMVVRLFSNFNN